MELAFATPGETSKLDAELKGRFGRLCASSGENVLGEVNVTVGTRRRLRVLDGEDLLLVQT